MDNVNNEVKGTVNIVQGWQEWACVFCIDTEGKTKTKDNIEFSQLSIDKSPKLLMSNKKCKEAYAAPVSG